MHPTTEIVTYPFDQFQPVEWDPSPGRTIFSVTRNHGIHSRYRLHNPKDEINDQRELLEKIIIEYQIGHNRYNLFSIGDFFESTYPMDLSAQGNIMGDLAEWIARRITKYFLKHFSRQGYSGGIFDKRFNPQERNNFLVAHTDTFVLKIDKYPNLVILKRTGKGTYGYENIKELDGLFDYRYGRKRHILVLESKLEKINVNCDDLITNLFIPLRQFFPDARLYYILFSERGSIFAKKDYLRHRRLKHLPLKIFETLRKEGIGVLFFTYNESRADFERMRDHLITQYRSITHLDLALYGKMMLSDQQIVLFDGGETPRIKLLKDPHSGMWKEVKLTHKSSRRK